GIKAQAEKAVQDWESVFRGKRDGLFQLMDRASVVVGPQTELEERGYRGETLKLSRSVIEDVDELFIMSSATGRVLQDARMEVRPNGLLGKWTNRFSRSRYERALSLLSEKAIRFEKGDPVRVLFEGRQEDENALLGKLEDYQPFERSFEELMARFDEKASRAVANLDRVETSWGRLAPTLEGISTGVTMLSDREETLQHLSRSDNRFGLSSIFDQLLPAITNRQKSAVEMGQGDPVTALEVPAAEAERMIREGQRLCQAVIEARSSHFPDVRSAAANLEKAGRMTGWIDEGYNALSDRADSLGAMGADRPIASEIQNLQDDLVAMKGRVVTAADLSRRADTELRDLIDALVSKVVRVRASIGKASGLGEEVILNENRLSPDHMIEEAELELAGARAAIDQGGVASANKAFQRIERLMTKGGDIVALSEEAFATVPEKLTEGRAERDRLRLAMERPAAMLEDMKDHYDPAVLSLSERDGLKLSGQDDLGDSLVDAERHLKAMETSLEKSETAYQSGRYVAAAGRMETAANEAGFAGHQLALVEDHHTALKQAEEANPGAINALQAKLEELRENVDDRRTTRPTIETYGRLLLDAAAWENQLSGPRPNPFELQREIQRGGETTDEIRLRIAGDRERHSETEAEVRAAQRAIEVTGEWVNRARQDRIPDSDAISESNRRFEKESEDLSATLRELRIDHNDWTRLHQSASEVIAGTTATAGTLREEVAAARTAVKAIRSASSAVREASGWTGRYGIHVTGSPGATHLRQAEEHLNSGHYREAARHAYSARKEAEAAIRKARQEEAMERDRRRRAARRAARRRRAAAIGGSSNSGFGGFRSGGGFSSGRSSSGGGFSSGGGSSSSGGSAGSGFSRSGW
ncbi:MAG: hypothetical protein AAF514_09265, partial [Verrucomicrobiota bacterium]